MRQWIESQYAVDVLQWAEPDDEGCLLFTVIAEGRWITAPSAALLLSALQDLDCGPLVLRRAA